MSDKVQVIWDQIVISNNVGNINPKFLEMTWIYSVNFIKFLGN